MWYVERRADFEDWGRCVEQKGACRFRFGVRKLTMKVLGIR